MKFKIETAYHECQELEVNEKQFFELMRTLLSDNDYREKYSRTFRNQAIVNIVNEGGRINGKRLNDEIERLYSIYQKEYNIKYAKGLLEVYSYDPNKAAVKRAKFRKEMGFEEGFTQKSSESW